MPDLGVIAHPAEQIVGNARRAAAASGDFAGALVLDFHSEQPRGAEDNLVELLGLVVIEPLANREAGQQRRSQQPAAGGRADERESGQVEPDAARVWSLVNDDVEFEILHGRVEVLLDRLLQAMDFVDEQHVAFFEVGQQAGEIAGFFDGRTAGAFEVGAHGLGEDVGQRGFAQARGPAQQDVIDRFVALFGGGDGDFQALLDLGLAGEFGEQRWPQRHFKRHVRLGEDLRNRAFRHCL